MHTITPIDTIFISYCCTKYLSSPYPLSQIHMHHPLQSPVLTPRHLFLSIGNPSSLVKRKREEGSPPIDRSKCLNRHHGSTVWHSPLKVEIVTALMQFQGTVSCYSCQNCDVNHRYVWTWYLLSFGGWLPLFAEFRYLFWQIENVSFSSYFASFYAWLDSEFCRKGGGEPKGILSTCTCAFSRLMRERKKHCQLFTVNAVIIINILSSAYCCNLDH